MFVIAKGLKDISKFDAEKDLDSYELEVIGGKSSARSHSTTSYNDDFNRNKRALQIYIRTNLHGLVRFYIAQ